MATTPKYKAKAVYFDSNRRVVIAENEAERYRVKGKLKLRDGIIRFDSQHEFKVYLELCRMYGAEMVDRQYKVQIYSSGLCYPKGKDWKVDFSIPCPSHPDRPEALVEAKGACLSEFAYTLSALEQLQPDLFDRLFIVFSDRIPVENKVISSLMNSNYEYRLLTLKELKCLQHLPLPL